MNAILSMGAVGQAFLALAGVAAAVMIAAGVRAFLSQAVNAPAFFQQVQKLAHAQNLERALKLAHASDAAICQLTRVGVTSLIKGFPPAPALEEALRELTPAATFGLLPAAGMGAIAGLTGLALGATSAGDARLVLLGVGAGLVVVAALLFRLRARIVGDLQYAADQLMALRKA